MLQRARAPCDRPSAPQHTRPPFPSLASAAAPGCGRPPPVAVSAEAVRQLCLRLDIFLANPGFTGFASRGVLGEEGRAALPATFAKIDAVPRALQGAISMGWELTATSLI